MDKQDETSVDKLARLRADSDQRRIPSDPVGPDSPVTINGYQTMQVMPLSQYDAEKDLLIVNVMIGKMRPDRAKEYLERIRGEIELCVKPTGWKHIMFVPITYDHPMHRQFRTVTVNPGNGGYQPTFDDLDENNPPTDLPGAISDEE